MPRDSSSTFASPQFCLRRDEAEPLEPLVDALVGFRGAHPLELGEEQQHAPHLHLLVQAALLGQIADAVEHSRRRVFGRAEARVIVPESGCDDVENHANRRRLAGAVGAEQAVDRSARDLKRQVAHGDVVAEALDDLANVDCQIRHELGF